MYKKMLLSASLLSIMFLSGCKDRSEVFIIEEDTVRFSNNAIVEMPNLRNSEKRGFSDLNCDGVEDMLEINDESSLFSMKDKYKINFFEGYLQDGETHYKSPRKIEIDIDLSYFKQALKIDTADLNGDQCADIVFTSVITKWRKPTTLQMKVAMNMGELKFLSSEMNMKMNTKDRNGFQYWFNELVKDIASDEDSSLSSYLKMDWADFDGNGTDDLALFVDDNDSLDIGIFYTEHTPMLKPSFVSLENFWIEKFLYQAHVNGIDTGDMNGDGLADIILERPVNGEKLFSGFAMNKGDRFAINQDKVHYFNVKTDYFSKASKRDVFDDNGDGKDDVVYITEMEDKPVKMVFKSQTK